MVPRVGQRVGPYEILGRLGSGGMGLVFSAWDARLQRDVAIKLLRDEYASPDMRSRFLQEARAASGLNHPNICTIFDIGEQGGDPYLVMELLKGETLRARITSGSISPEDIVRVATEVADALTVAHTRGIIHRDIKPANIILVDKPGGRFGTKVLDFGLAKVDIGDGHERFDLTSIGSTVGTVSYMSPEQARGEPLDARSDLFSLGIVLYEMATGQVPFRGATSALVFVQLLSHPPEVIREINAAIPKDLEKVILKLLEKDRSQRYQNAAEVVDALHRVQMKWPGAGKSIWGAIPSLVRGLGESAVSKADGSPVPLSPAPAAVVSPPVVAPVVPVLPAAPVKPPMGESMLRPVRRIVTSEAGGSPPPATSKPIDVKAEATPISTPVATAGSGSEPAVAASSGSSSAAVSARDSRASKTPVPAPFAPPAGARMRSSSRLSAPRFARLDEVDEPRRGKSSSRSLQDAGDESETRHTQRWVLIGVVLAVIAGAAWVFYYPRHSAPVGAQTTTLVMAPLNNRTGDDILSGVLNAGLIFDLQQSTHLAVRDSDDLQAGLHATGAAEGPEPSMDDMQKAAQAINASRILFGDIHSAGSAYTVDVHVRDSSTGADIVDVTETAASREQLADAVDRLASGVRSGLGETGDSIGKTAVPLSKEATSNLDALQAYVAGEEAMTGGHYLDSMHDFEHAATADPRFTQAYLALAELYRRQRAGKSAAVAAGQAQNSSQASSGRTQLLAQASYAMNASGDYPRATQLLQQVLAEYPGDADSAMMLATVLRLQGKFAESLEVSERVVAQNPYDLNASGAAEVAMLDTERPEAAAQMEAQIQKSGHSHPGLRVLINYLSSRENGQVGVDLSQDPDRVAPAVYQAAVLDAGGLLAGGLQMWRGIAGQTGAQVELTSAAGEALSTAALDRALVGDCATATGLLREAGTHPLDVEGLAESGMTAALCGNLDLARQDLAALQQAGPQSFAVKGFLAPDLAGLLQWKAGDAPGALRTLSAAKQYDLISVTPYLRGLIHLKSGQPALAVVDFQAMLEHRGATTIANPVLYAMAQIGLARAYEASGDRGTNAATAYKKFLALWSAADSGQEMVREARAATK